MPNATFPVVMQEVQTSLWRQQLNSQLRESNLRDIAHLRREHVQMRSSSRCAFSKELASEKQQHGNFEQQLSAVKQDDLHFVNELKVCYLIFLQVSRNCFKSCFKVVLQGCNVLPAKSDGLRDKAYGACIALACSNNAVVDKQHLTPTQKEHLLLSSATGHNRLLCLVKIVQLNHAANSCLNTNCYPICRPSLTV